MGASTKREAEHLARECRRQGFRVKETRKGYIVYANEGDGRTVGWHKTASDHRWRKNVIAALRRIGVDL